MGRGGVTFVALALATAVCGCGAVEHSTVNSCADFDRAYRIWTAATATAHRPARLVAADTRFVQGIDDAIAEATGSSLTGALQALAALTRTHAADLENGEPAKAKTTIHEIPVAITAIRQTCPPT